MAGLQQGDREGEDEVTRHHQQQQDPEHVCHDGSINADEEDENYFKPGRAGVLVCATEGGGGGRTTRCLETFTIKLINEDK